jgi:hypothetical protein
MTEERSKPCGLIGTITSDNISWGPGRTREGLGGILYQASVLCGLGEDVSLITNCSREIASGVGSITVDWATLRRDGMRIVPGPPNRVHLEYPERGERVEVLDSAVPPLTPDEIIPRLPGLGMLLLVLNSGFDIGLGDWRTVLRKTACPVWLDIHSLALEPVLGTRRLYRPLPEWRAWARGVTFLQANIQEAACMLGDPARMPSEEDLAGLADGAFQEGVRVVFVTMGNSGVLVAETGKTRRIVSPNAHETGDTTGCGDVFGAGTIAGLGRGRSPFEAAAFGAALASRAASMSGIGETYKMAEAARAEASRSE